jgi:hypothetical protein
MRNMDERPIQDIIPPRKSIRDVPLPERRLKRIGSTEIPANEVNDNAKDYAEDDKLINNYREEKGPRTTLWVIAIALVFGVFLSFFFLYSKANVEILIKNENINVALTATSTREGSNGTIPYSIITIEKIERIEVPSGTTLSAPTTAVGNQGRKASGTITVYNNHSTSPQPLVATTRFQSKDGLIYRIDKDIVVPGQRIENGQTVAGSIDAIVYADQSGPNYNVGMTEFIIPGFQGTSKASTIYARSKTEITGGSNTSSSVTVEGPANIQSARAELQNIVRQQLALEVKNKTPDTFIFFENGLSVDYGETIEDIEGKTYLIGRGVALAPIFNKKFLTMAVNTTYGKNYLALEGFDSLQVDIRNKEELLNGDFPPLQLNMNGALRVGEEINIAELKRTLAGKPKEELSSILSVYPSVATANVSVRPFWKNNFPDNSNKISIKLTKQE